MSSVPLFRYVAPLQSTGDRLALTLDFPDERTSTAALSALGLSAIAGWKVGSGIVRSADGPLHVEVFGPNVEILVGPEDGAEHVTGEHVAQATRIAAGLRAVGAEAYVAAPLRLPAYGRYAVVTSSAEDALVKREARWNARHARSYTLRIGSPTPWGFETGVLGRPRGGAGSVAPELTAAARCIDGRTGRALEPSALRPGLVGRASTTVGRRSDGMFGLVVHELRLFIPDAAEIARAGRLRRWLEQYGVASPTSDEDAAALEVVADHEEVHPLPAADAAVARLLVARHALSRSMLPSRLAVVGGALQVLRACGLPCTFSARRILEGAGDDLDVVLAEMASRVDRALVEARSPRRFEPLFFGVGHEPTYLLATAEEREAWIADGVARRTPPGTADLERRCAEALTDVERYVREGRLSPRLATTATRCLSRAARGPSSIGALAIALFDATAEMRASVVDGGDPLEADGFQLAERVIERVLEVVRGARQRDTDRAAAG